MRLRDETGFRRVWLKSFWGFNPEYWGCIGFTQEYRRDRFVCEFFRQDAPPGLIAIYVATSAPPKNQHMRGRIVGVLELSEVLGFAEEFIDLAKEPSVRDELAAGRWRYSVKATRAWKIEPDAWPQVDVLASESYWPGRARYIGVQGVELSEAEASRILDLPVTRAELFPGR